MMQLECSLPSRLRTIPENEQFLSRIQSLTNQPQSSEYGSREGIEDFGSQLSDKLSAYQSDYENNSVILDANNGSAIMNHSDSASMGTSSDELSFSAQMESKSPGQPKSATSMSQQFQHTSIFSEQKTTKASPKAENVAPSSICSSSGQKWAVHNGGLVTRSSPFKRPVDNLTMKKVHREASRKGKDIVEAAKKTGVKFFCVSVNEPAGDVGLLIEAVKVMNEGDGADIGKMAFACSDAIVAIVSYLPADYSKMCKPAAWLHRVATDALGPEYRSFCGDIEEDHDAALNMNFARMQFMISDRDKRLGITAKRVKKIFQQQLFPRGVNPKKESKKSPSNGDKVSSMSTQNLEKFNSLGAKNETSSAQGYLSPKVNAKDANSANKNKSPKTSPKRADHILWKHPLPANSTGKTGGFDGLGVSVRSSKTASSKTSSSSTKSDKKRRSSGDKSSRSSGEMDCGANAREASGRRSFGEREGTSTPSGGQFFAPRTRSSNGKSNLKHGKVQLYM